VDSPEPFLGLHDAAKVLGVSSHTLYAYVAHDRVPYYKVGGRLRFRRSQLVAWVESSRRGPEVAMAQ